MEQYPLYEINNHSANHKVPHLVWNPKFYCCVSKNSHWSFMNPVNSHLCPISLSRCLCYIPIPIDLHSVTLGAVFWYKHTNKDKICGIPSHYIQKCKMNKFLHSCKHLLMIKDLCFNILNLLNHTFSCQSYIVIG